MAPQGIEEIESRVGNGMGQEASNLQDLVCATSVGEPQSTKCMPLALQKKGVSVAWIAARVRPEIAPQGIERLKSGSEIVWARKPRTYKTWYTGVRLVAGVMALQRKGVPVALIAARVRP
jgi:hypothetical protein